MKEGNNVQSLPPTRIIYEARKTFEKLALETYKSTGSATTSTMGGEFMHH